MQEVHLAAGILVKNGKVREEGKTADKVYGNEVTAWPWWLSPSVGL